RSGYVVLGHLDDAAVRAEVQFADPAVVDAAVAAALGVDDAGERGRRHGDLPRRIRARHDVLRAVGDLEGLRRAVIGELDVVRHVRTALQLLRDALDPILPALLSHRTHAHDLRTRGRTAAALGRRDRRGMRGLR